jgi:hypothetical protein
VVMEPGVGDAYEGRGTKFLVVMELICGRKRTGVIERGVHWFCGNEFKGIERMV